MKLSEPKASSLPQEAGFCCFCPPKHMKTKENTIMFEKRTVIYKKKDKETWTKIKSALKEGGLTGFKASHYLQDSVMAGGCGAKLDPRDFGSKGKIDHEVYVIKVKKRE